MRGLSNAGRLEVFKRQLPDVGPRVIDGALLGLALMLVKIRLQLLLGFFGVRHKFAPRAEG